MELAQAAAEAPGQDPASTETNDAHGQKDEDPSTSGRPNDEASVPDSDDEGGDGEVADPLEGLSERKKKLYLLKQKLKECRKANQHAVIAENKRKQVRLPGTPSLYV